MTYTKEFDEKAQCFLVSNIRTNPDVSVSYVYGEARRRMKSIHVSPANAQYSIFRKSIDARKKDNITLVWTVMVKGEYTEKDCQRLQKSGFRACAPAFTPAMPGAEVMQGRPVVVGSGPAGLFCAYLLTIQGYRPLLIERGGSIEERVEAVNRFFTKAELDVSTNIQFGAGGAGTFSDGKLTTRTNDPYIPYVLQTFVQFGAPEDILTQAKPHIGTDILRTIIAKMTDFIISGGGDVYFHTQMLDIHCYPQGGGSILTNRGDIPFGTLVLAIGHSARDTYKMLLARQFQITPKPFSVGVRVEHLQSDIDDALYGKYAGHPALGHAEYALSCNTDQRGVYTFCMCPGGVVVAAASEENTVVVNGMSYHARDGKNANAAVAVSVRPEDYGNTPQKAIRFQQSIEESAFLAGGSTYAAPLVTMGDFLLGEASAEPSRILPTYMGGNAYKIASPDTYLPSFVCDSLRDGLVQFERSISGYTVPDAVITGAETRTSSPVRILRREDKKTAIGYDCIYPCGEGAGYAGGITSAAVDGLRCAQAIIERYAPKS